MAFSSITTAGDGVTIDYAVTFDYLERSHVSVLVGKVRTTAVGSNYTFEWINSTTIRVRTVVASDPVPSGLEIVILRETPIDTPAVVFGAGPSLTSDNLNKNSEYLTYALQEATDDNDAFLTLYLGSKPADPTVNNSGDPLQVGAIYFNTTNNTPYFWTGSQWNKGDLAEITEQYKDAAEAAKVASEAAQTAAEASQTASLASQVAAAASASSASADAAATAALRAGADNVVLTFFKYTATAAQTVFTGADDNAETLTYTLGNAVVFLNGVTLVRGVDYTESSITTLTLTSGATVGDTLIIVNFSPGIAGDAAGAQQITYDQGGLGAVQRTVKSRLQDFVSIKDFGGVCDGVTNDADALIAALGTGQEVIIPETSYISLSAGQVQTFIENLNLVSPKQITEFLLPAGDHAITQQVEVTNPDARNIVIKGDVRAQVTLTAAVSVGGGPRAHSIRCTLSDASDVEVDDYLYIGYTSGTGAFNAVEGVWKVTAKSGSDVTVKNTINAAWPTMTASGGRVVPLKTILRWPISQRGLAISGCQLRTIENLVLASQFDITSGSPVDSYSDGLQVGTASDQLNTGEFESQQTNGGEIWCKNVGIVEWEGNGVQTLGGNAYFFQAAACSNGWRGFQAARTGSVLCKACIASGNGTSGFQAEAMGLTNANDGVAVGNWEQGVYVIGTASVSFIDGFSLLNQAAGLDARNYGTILADGAKVDGNVLRGINSVAGNVLFGANATASNNGTGVGTSVDVNTSEGGVVNGNGASSLGIVRTSTVTSSVVIDTDGEQIWDNALFVESRSTGAKNSIANTSIGDLVIKSDVSGSGTYLDLLRIKGGNGTFFPNQDAGADLGRASGRWSTIYAATGSINTSDAREKTDIDSLSAAEIAVAKRLKGLVRKFRFQSSVDAKGDAARIHVGVIAQDVKSAFEAEGLDPFAYGVLCFDQWEESTDSDGAVSPAGDRYGVRYDQLFAFIIAAL